MVLSSVVIKNDLRGWSHWDLDFGVIKRGDINYGLLEK